MVPAYKVVLFTSFGASMYMMGRMVLVSCSCSERVRNANRLVQGHKTWWGKN